MSVVAPIDYLLSRRSVKFVQAPGPTEDELAQILQSAMSAPDHGKLQPWRFALIRGDAVGRSADMALGSVKSAGFHLPPVEEASNRRWPGKTSLLVGVHLQLNHAD